MQLRGLPNGKNQHQMHLTGAIERGPTFDAYTTRTSLKTLLMLAYITRNWRSKAASSAPASDESVHHTTLPQKSPAHIQHWASVWCSHSLCPMSVCHRETVPRLRWILSHKLGKRESSLPLKLHLLCKCANTTKCKPICARVLAISQIISSK